MPASRVTDAFDWWPIAERLANLIGQPLLAEGIPAHRVRPAARRRSGDDREAQLALDLERPESDPA